MQLQHLRPKHKPKTKKRIGRGGKKGFTSGKGSKGQNARAGRRFKPLIRSLFKRYPKLRGHRMESQPAFLVGVNLDKIERHFQAGETINPQVLIGKKIIFFPGNQIPLVKILGNGEMTKSLIFENCQLSKGAEAKIKKAGGIIK
ncbi:MAG: 50S ribosomal protein L15 [Candidatus Nealsonbacteria bacterium]|nr:50S ribosomal protein L15 [Candidatus Nealsonbacteria bacterium]